MDHITLLVRAFLIGVSSSCGLGPVFILLCNTAIRRGFFAAVSIAVGAAFVDSIYFYAALSGALSWFYQYDWFVKFFDAILAAIFSLLAVHFLYVKKEQSNNPHLHVHSYYEGFFQGFFITLINPLVSLYFLGMSAKFLSMGAASLTLMGGIEAAMAVFAGSCSMLVLLAGLVKFVGVRFNASRLDFINKLTAYLFILLALYFAYSFLISFFH